MRAILLAAGRGRRLESDGPKVLLSFEGKTLLERHLANLTESGVTALTIVVGFQRQRIDAALAKLRPAMEIELLENPRFVHGSIVSLQTAGHRLAEGAVWMDADVLYPAALMRKLVGSKHDNCVLLDGRSEETGEEMMLGTRGGRVFEVARRVGKDWDQVGEAVGFAKAGREGGAVLRRILDAEVGAGRLDQEYEAAMNAAFQEVPFGFERVDEFPWTEIDFQEDVARANELVKLL
jgi:choline kinase